MTRPRPPAVRVYGALLRLLPTELRTEFGEEAEQLFGELYAEARRHGRGAGARLWLRSVGALIGCAIEARRDERRISNTRFAARREGRGGGETMRGWLKDLQYGLRTLRRRPGFGLTAVLILGTGIGATTTIFSVVDRVVLRPLPYPEAGRLVHFDQGAHSYPSLRGWLEMDAFELLSAARDFQVDLTGEGPPERLPAAAVSEAFFDLFGGAPAQGRLFVPEDYPGDRTVAVLGHGFWTRLGADRSLIGRTLTLDGAPTTIVGVLDASFRPPPLETGSRVDVWFPLDDGGEFADDHGYHVLGVAARLRPGVGLEAAQAEVDGQRAALAEERPNRYLDRDGQLVRTPLVDMREATVRDVRGMLFVVLGAVGTMLLIACANVANLFLARGTARGREIALRGALGAGRMRIARGILSESVAVSLVGGVLGVALAFVGVELFVRFMPDGIPRVDDLSVDLRILLFSVAISVGTGVLFGTLPALQATRRDVHSTLKDGAGTASAHRAGRRWRAGLVVAEIALAMVLVLGAGLLFRSFVARVQVDPGFRTEGLAILPLALEAGYDGEERAQFVRELIDRVEAMPGTESAAVAWGLPFRYTGQSRCCWRTSVIGDPTLHDDEEPFASMVHPVSAGYFATLDAPLVAGREFTDVDERGERPVAILNATAAEALFGGDGAVGRTISLRDDRFEVVGVEGGVHHWGLDQEVEPAIYLPYLSHGPELPRLELVVRSTADPAVVAPALRDAVWAIDPDLPLGSVVTMEQRIGGSLAQPRFLSGLLGGFALVALILACGGIYGSMLYTVGQRRQELGIRLALGADRHALVGMVLRHGAWLATLGVVLGIGLGLTLADVLQRLVWGVPPTDPLTFATSALLLGGSALLAAFVPAWRAARTDPLETLRAE